MAGDSLKVEEEMVKVTQPLVDHVIQQLLLVLLFKHRDVEVSVGVNGNGTSKNFGLVSN
jgi:hypothetical protein